MQSRPWENVKDDYPKAIRRSPLKSLIGAILKFVDVADTIDDRVPAWGYQDDRSRLKTSLQSFKPGWPRSPGINAIPPAGRTGARH